MVNPRSASLPECGPTESPASEPYFSSEHFNTCQVFLGILKACDLLVRENLLDIIPSPYHGPSRCSKIKMIHYYVK